MNVNRKGGKEVTRDINQRRMHTSEEDRDEASSTHSLSPRRHVDPTGTC